ncbi:hypothetical protein BJY01DRAFT_228475 [Aspergillus pseudoustus]|uniref:P-loop containing nucleoside triphosphate hydrolase protein n=1 Tax=Aspergillus pseudoustus TaxID=1810923 RepID=A0ABR4IKS2_9EURO
MAAVNSSETLFRGSSSQENVLPSVEFSFSYSPFSGGRATPPSSSDALSDPEVDQLSLTSTTQAFVQNLRLSDHQSGTSHAPGASLNSTQRVSELGPGSHTTYRDLYNATPSPANIPPTEQREQRPQTPTSPLGGVSAHLQDLNLGDSWETASASSDHNSDPNLHELSVRGDGAETDSDYLYNIREEELPQAPIYDIRLQNALRNIRGQLTDLAHGMGLQEQALDSTTIFHSLYEQTLSASRFTYPATRTVGFIGDSGMGKSSVINSILDIEGLARSSGDGTACTNIVTEFRSVDDEHPNNYTVEADFMDNFEIEELLEELLSAVRKYYTGAYREVSEPEEQENIRSAARRAWDTLLSIFPDQPELDLDFVSQEGENVIEPIISSLVEWAVARQDSRPGGRNSLQYSVVANHADECMKQLDDLMADGRDRRKPTVWPFIKLIRVYLRSPILRTGLILADLPGFRDLNYARVRATEKYLRHSCNEVFIVSTIFRCTSDRSIKDIIRRCPPNQPIRIICTRSEDVNAKETARAAPVAESKQIQGLHARIEALEKRIRQVRTLRRQTAGNRNQNLFAEQEILSDQKDALELELKRFLISRRNLRVTKSLLRAYKDLQIRVFCVSNSLYRDHRAMDPEQASAYLELSGIRELRRYCQSVPADAQLRETESFLRNQLPATLGSLIIWASASGDVATASRAETLRGVLREADQTLQRALVSRRSLVRLAQESLEDRFKTLIEQEIRNSRKDWKDDSVSASRDWAGWHHATYAAWCRHNGTHETQKQSYRCWNEEILGHAVTQLSNNWDAMLDFVEDKKDNLSQEILDLFQGLCDSIEEHNDIAPDTLRGLTLNITARRRCIVHTIHSTLDDLIFATDKMKLDTIGGHDSSYIAGVMRTVYNSCREQYGTGSDLRRKQTMNRHLTSSTLFREFAKNISGEFQSLVERAVNRLDQELREEIANVSQDLRASTTIEREESEGWRDHRYAEELRQKVEVIKGTLDHAWTLLREVRQVTVASD